MNVFITGINGFLGSRLAEYLLAGGHTVVGSARNVDATPPELRRQCTLVPHALGDPVDDTIFHGLDRLVHGAHDFRRDAEALNVEGTRELFEAARRAGVARQIYLSSYSARPDTSVEYGRTKYRIEQEFLAADETVVRPGLVIGDGGLFGRNLERMLSTRVVPLLDGGVDLLPLIGIEDFVRAMTRLIDSGEAGAFNLFAEGLVSMRELVERVQQTAGRRVLYVSIPTRVAIGALGALAKLGIPLPVDVDNLRALKRNQRPLHESDLRRLLGDDTSVDAMLKRAVDASRARQGRVPPGAAEGQAKAIDGNEGRDDTARRG